MIFRQMSGNPILDLDISAGIFYCDILAKSKGINSQDLGKMIAAHCENFGYISYSFFESFFIKEIIPNFWYFTKEVSYPKR